MALIHPWPIILFHPGDYDGVDERSSLKRGLLEKIGYEKDALAFAERIEFERLYWELPEGIPSNISEINPLYDWVWPGTRFN
jgi:mannosyltransferase